VQMQEEISLFFMVMTPSRQRDGSCFSSPYPTTRSAVDFVHVVLVVTLLVVPPPRQRPPLHHHRQTSILLTTTTTAKEDMIVISTIHS
jgi:hypothetical protein